MSQKVVFNLVLLVRIPKWGLPFLYRLYPKIIVKKYTFVKFSDYYLNIPLCDYTDTVITTRFNG